MAFDLLDYPIVAHSPRVMSITSAWLGHIPFAFAVTQMTRPARLVELGTHRGDSYCTFCEAVLTLGLKTRCTAVDTWAGDDHAGEYGADVLAELRAVHDPAFGNFSDLSRTTFDEAAAAVPDGSVDLLHIDGLHTYKAVRGDYDAWLPKMSPAGVVLFHDTAERHTDFGVWRLWAEVSAGRPGFEFTHSHGLGVVAVGPTPPGPLVEFLDAANARPRAVRQVFERLAMGLEQLRFARRMLAPMINIQTNLNEWATTLGRPVDPADKDVVAAVNNPVKFAQKLGDRVRGVLGEDLALRRPGGR